MKLRSLAPVSVTKIKHAKNAYVKALEYNKNHAKALQQLGWLHYKDEDDFRSAIEYLKRASEIGDWIGLVLCRGFPVESGRSAAGRG